jgi:L-seryl-tRNA(Ser) seleniumtransferase
MRGVNVGSKGGDSRRRLPSVDRLLSQAQMAPLLGLYGRDLVTVQVRSELAGLRAELAAAAATGEPSPDPATVLERLPGRAAAALLARLAGATVRVLNATGILLHTNLGRAPLPSAVARELPALLDRGCDLELDLASGRRGDRNRRCGALLEILTGADSGLVVNNNAAALVLALSTLAVGREVIVSRGELVEIGGSFRIPEILAASGARLVEVGTTNRTRLGDYAAAIGPQTALLLKVFPSNYQISGFTEAVPPARLAELAREQGVTLLVDEGSGLLRRHPSPQLAAHPSHDELVAAGCDLVCGSGDKLLGGPQAGLLVGRRELVARCQRHPLYRALRPGRTVLVALEAVLRLHLRRMDVDGPPPTGDRLPLDEMWPPPDRLRQRLTALAAALLSAVPAAEPELRPAAGYLGGGSAPEAPVIGEALTLPDRGDLVSRLRRVAPPVLCYAREGRVWIDLRTVDPADDGDLAQALIAGLVG